MIKTTLLASAALALVASGAIASPKVTLSKDHRVVSVAPSGAKGTSAGRVAFPGVYSYNGFAKKYPNGLYFCCYGGTISGPSSFFGAAYANAVGWTPTTSATIKKLSSDIGYVSGDQSVTLTLYADSGSGTPGAALTSGTGTTTSTFGSCCGVTTVKIKGTNVTAGTPYWIGISTTGTNFEAAGYGTVDEVNPHAFAFSSDGGTTWTGTSTTLVPAVAAK